MDASLGFSATTWSFFCHTYMQVFDLKFVICITMLLDYRSHRIIDVKPVNKDLSWKFWGKGEIGGGQPWHRFP